MTEKLNSVTFSRRSFAKGATVTAAAAALASALGSGARPKAFAESAPKNAANEGTRGEVFGHCRMCMMCGSCSFVATVKDGVVVNIEGDPDRKTNMGGLCARGKSSIVNLYNPYRIKAPMVRTNPEKGMEIDPGWKEISWDEAIGMAAQKMGEALKKDPR
ncbi:MAG: molybdopterin dinucleotide-binding protein, partial [Eggerthellaceae bacterium]|nr:molybdopterin dinucleotide-binding protein [Eggerthellaceae bacterium]